MGTYRQLYERSLEQPEAFWAEAAEALHWDRRWDRVLDADKAPFYRWFAGGTLNTCFNAVDRHVASGRGGQPAIIHDSPVTGTKRVITYAELKDQVARFAGALVRLGVRKGDRVIVYMPMVPEALVAMLACARIGAVHSVVFGGFASPELATRIDDAKPKVVVSASCGIEGARCIPYKPLLDKALDLASHKVAHCVVLQRPQATAELRPGRDLDWHEAVAAAHPVDCVPVAATDPLYILYTSGTTGQPKGVVRDNGGHAVGPALDHAQPLRRRARRGVLVRVRCRLGRRPQLHRLRAAPERQHHDRLRGQAGRHARPRRLLARGVRAQGGGPLHRPDRVPRHPQGGPGRRPHPPLRPLPPRALYLAGERCDPDTLLWAEAQLGVPVIDHWWQTETGWCICGNPLGIERLPVKPGSPTVPMPGYDVRVLDEAGRRRPGRPDGRHRHPPAAAAGLPAHLVERRRALPAGLPRPLPRPLPHRRCRLPRRGRLPVHHESHRRRHQRRRPPPLDRRHRGGPGLAPDVAECAVIGVADPLKGELPLGLVVLKAGVARDDEAIRKELVARVRDQIGPVASFRLVAIVNRLPKTRSGKILRGTMKKIADGSECKVPATIDDPVILEEIGERLRELGYALPG